MTFWAKLKSCWGGCCGGPHSEHYDGWLARERLRQYHASEQRREALQRDNFALEMQLGQAMNILESYQSFSGMDRLGSFPLSSRQGSLSAPGRQASQTSGRQGSLRHGYTAAELDEAYRSSSFAFAQHQQVDYHSPPQPPPQTYVDLPPPGAASERVGAVQPTVSAPSALPQPLPMPTASAAPATVPATLPPLTPPATSAAPPATSAPASTPPASAPAPLKPRAVPARLAEMAGRSPFQAFAQTPVTSSPPSTPPAYRHGYRPPPEPDPTLSAPSTVLVPAQVRLPAAAVAPRASTPQPRRARPANGDGRTLADKLAPRLSLDSALQKQH